MSAIWYCDTMANKISMIRGKTLCKNCGYTHTSFLVNDVATCIECYAKINGSSLVDDYKEQIIR